MKLMIMTLKALKAHEKKVFVITTLHSAVVTQIHTFPNVNKLSMYANIT